MKPHLLDQEVIDMILRHATECIGTDGVDGLRGHILTLTALLAAIAAHDSELAKVEKRCHVCGDQTLLACSDCQINFAATVYVCSKSDCRDEHERKCYGAKQQHLDDCALSTAMIKCGLVTGHGDAIADMAQQIPPQVMELRDRLSAAEAENARLREALEICAGSGPKKLNLHEDFLRREAVARAALKEG